MEVVPSWNQDYPAKKQAAALDVASNKMPEPSIPAANTQHEPAAPEAMAAQTLPTEPERQPTAAAPEPPKFEDTEEIPAPKGPKFEDTEPITPDALTPSIPDNGALKKYIGGNLQVYNAANSEKAKLPEQREATSFLESLEAGWGMSVTGLGIAGKMPDVVPAEHGPMAYRIANQIGSLAGDMPAMIAGGFFGGLAGSEAPIIGNIVGAGMGGFAAPAAMRKIMIDHYTKGDITTAGEFVDRLMSTSWEAIKGATTGAATAMSGGAAAVAGPIASIGAELAAMTTVGAFMEGHFPHAQDFVDGAIVLGGVHGMGTVSAKLRNIYAATGERPETIVAAAATDPELKSKLLSPDKESPEQAASADLKHLTIANPEGEKEAILRNQLVPSDVSVKPPEPKESERSAEEQQLLKRFGTEPVKASDSAEEIFNKTYAKNVDFLDPLKVAYMATKVKTGVELPADKQAYVLGRNYGGVTDKIRNILDNGFPSEESKFSGRGLNDIYRDVPNDDQTGFDLYSVAKHAESLYQNGIMPWKDFESERESNQKIIDSGADKFQKLHEERVQFRNEALMYGVDKGVINNDVAGISILKHPDSIPMSKILTPDEMGDIPGGSGQLVKKIKGDSDLLMKDPRNEIYNQVAAIIKRADINEIRLAALDNTNYTENGEQKNDFIKEVSAYKPVKVGDDDFVNVLKGINRETQIPIYRDGKLSLLEGTPLVIDSLKRLEGDKTSMGLILKLAQGFSTVARTGQLLDPGFAARHGIRAGITTGLYTQTGQVPFYHSALSLKEFMGQSSEDYLNWVHAGGLVSGADGLEKSYINNDLQKADSQYPFFDQAWNLIKKPLEANEAVIKLTDNLSRFTEAKRYKEQNPDASWVEAAFVGREVSPDYAKRGLERSALRTAIAFQGAHINSLDRMVQSFKEDTQGTILRASVLSGISAMLWYANKDDKDIQNLPAWQKDLYWNFKVPNLAGEDSGGYIMKIPKPWSPGILFGSGMERTLDKFFTDKPEAFDGFGKSLLDSVVPSMIPNMVAPVLDQMANKNLFSGQQLVNTHQQSLSPELKYTPYTSETAKQLSKVLSNISALPGVPNISKVGPSADPLGSPAVIENYIKGWTGIAGGWALKLSDAGLRAAGVTPQNVGVHSADTLADTPILNEFLTRFPSMKTQPIENFYKNYAASKEVFDSINNRMKAGDVNAATSFLLSHQRDEVKLDGISKGLNIIRQTISNTQNNPAISPTQKRQLIDQQYYMAGSMAELGNQMMREHQKQLDQSTRNKGE